MVRRFDTDCRSAGHHSLLSVEMRRRGFLPQPLSFGRYGQPTISLFRISRRSFTNGRQRIRKNAKKQDAAFDRFIIPQGVRPCGAGTASPCQLSHFSLSAIGIPQRNLGWREEFPERIIAKGGTGRESSLFGVDGYNFADVTFDQNGGINCALVNIVPLKRRMPHPSVSDTEGYR